MDSELSVSDSSHTCMHTCTCICSAQSKNLEIVLLILRMWKLCFNLKVAQT